MKEIISKSVVDELGNLYFDVTVKEENGVVTQKRLLIEEYIMLFTNNCILRESFVTVPKLPKEVIACQISSREANSFDAVVLYPAAKRPFLFCGQHFLVPFPALIARMSVREGVRKSTSLYALTTDKPTEDTLLMQYPYGNVDKEGGCCFGNILMEELEDASYAPCVLDAFLCGETNNDHYHQQNTEKLSQGKLLEKVKDLKSFPKKLLIPTKGKVINVGVLTKF